MSVANYTTSVWEHTQILVSVKSAEGVNTASLQYVIKKLACYNTLEIKDAGRTINVRFVTDESMLNSRWGRFQAHRQACGFIYIAEAENAMEAALIIDKFNKLRDEYGPDLCHSRCVVFGLDTAIRPSHSHNVFQFSTQHAWKSIDYDIKQFIVSIFYELESKRLKLTQERGSRPSAIRTPFDTLEEATLEGDSKLMRKRYFGRHCKYLADVNLLLGLLSESLLCYSTALDTLISTNDTVWVGCALEGYCALSAIVLLSQIENNPLSRENNAGKFGLDPRNLSNKQGSTSSFAEMKKLCIPSIKDLVDKYREAIINYSRHKSLSVIELEACIKATKVFAKANKFLEASEFVQNAVYITLNVPDTERLKRYSIMADLYKDLNFNRKSFFYKRVAAMQCVAPQLRNPDWDLCKKLLSEAVSTLITSSQPYDIEDYGWPSIVQRVWRELVFALERVGDHVLASMYLLHMLIHMFPFISQSGKDEKEACTSLESYAKIGSGDTKSQHNMFPFDFKFYKLPIVKAVLPQINVGGLRPVKTRAERSPESVFIYTPTSYKSKNQEQQRIHFEWGVNTPCRFDVEVFNPLSHCTLLVSDFYFIFDTEGDNPACPPSSFSILPQTTSKVQIAVIPVNPGSVKVLGYAFRIFGVLAKCYFKQVTCMKMVEIIMQVIPELPLLECNFQSGKLDSPEKDMIIYCGEISDLPHKLTNTGRSAVTNWTVTFKTKPDEDDVVLALEEDFKGLSLFPGETTVLPVKVESKVAADPGKTIQLHLCIKYAGQVDQNTWWRSIDVEVMFQIQPSVTVEKFTVQDFSDTSTTECILSLTLRNYLNTSVEVCYNSAGVVQQSAFIPKKSTSELRICVEKKKLHEATTTDDLDDVLLTYAKEKMNLVWKMNRGGAVEHSGSIKNGCNLSPQNLPGLLSIPMTCCVSFDNRKVTGEGNYSVQTNEARSVCFSFTNTGTFTQRFEVQVEIFQDQKNGFIERNLDECVLCLGSEKCSVCIEPSNTYEFAFFIMILKEGIYSLRASYHIALYETFDSKYSDSKYSVKCLSPSLLLNAQSYIPALADSENV